MRARRAIAVCLAFLLSGCLASRQPLNPPRLVTSGETDMAVQLFMQATILLANHYGYTTIRYADIQARSARAGFDVIPFMPPESVRATPELVGFFNEFENNRDAVNAKLASLGGGYKLLVKYYIRTGLRASQSICRNYLLNLEERNAYLEFLQKEFGVAMALASGILLIVNANNTLTQGFLLGTTSTNAALDAYQEFRFLNVDRDAALALVEAAQNKLAAFHLDQVDKATAESISTAGGYTFSDALRAVSLIEQQCTRTGIRLLLSRSIANSPTNLDVDTETGNFTFKTTKESQGHQDEVDRKKTGKNNSASPMTKLGVSSGSTNAGSSGGAPGSSGGAPGSSGTSPGSVETKLCLPAPDTTAADLIIFLCPEGAIRDSRRKQLIDLKPELAGSLEAVLTGTAGTPADRKGLLKLLRDAIKAGKLQPA